MEFQTLEGICKYCGNKQPVMAADQKDADIKITNECDCGGAKKEKTHKAMLKNLENTVGDKASEYGFREVSPQQRKAIDALAEAVFNEHIEKASINVDHTVLTIAMVKDKVRIIRKKTRVLEFEG